MSLLHRTLSLNLPASSQFLASTTHEPCMNDCYLSSLMHDWFTVVCIHGIASTTRLVPTKLQAVYIALRPSKASEERVIVMGRNIQTTWKQDAWYMHAIIGRHQNGGVIMIMIWLTPLLNTRRYCWPLLLLVVDHGGVVAPTNGRKHT